MDKKDTSWGNVAGWYDQLIEEGEGTYQKDLILPNLQRLVDPQKGQKLLDIACGQGFFSRVFAQKGMIVEGADISPELIAAAQKHLVDKPEASNANIHFETAPADKLSFAKNESFDKAIIILALQNIENFQGALSEAARSLKSGGSLYIVLNHPAFRIPKSSGWQWDEKTHARFRRIDSYMSDSKNKIEMNPGARTIGDKKFTFSFHRPLQVYFKALVKAGFTVGRLEEWVSHKKSAPGPRQAEEDRIRKEIPIFLFLEAVKK